jgi:SAM-dependent methyltransferase
MPVAGFHVKPYAPAVYWDRRYREGRTSGAGSEGAAAQAKADWLNALFAREKIASVIDWGCGDGTVLALLDLDPTYAGVDVSSTILDRNRARWPEHRWMCEGGSGLSFADVPAELAVSSDVILHLVDDADYDRHLAQVFGSSDRFVAIHGTDHDGGRTARHVRWRHWTPDVADRFPEWRLIEEPAWAPQVPGWWLYQW